MPSSMTPAVATGLPSSCIGGPGGGARDESNGWDVALLHCGMGFKPAITVDT